MGMDKKGTAYLPLHYGKPPERLYKKIVELTGRISTLICETYGTREFIRRISDPFWFHSLSLVTGFDWNSSGTTTTTIHALKQYADQHNTDFFVAGGKGKYMREKARDIKIKSQYFQSEMATRNIVRDTDLMAKVDNNLLQDSYDLYIHSVVLDYRGNYSVIQQGMNQEDRMARRYHWSSLHKEDSLIEDRSGIESQKQAETCLDLSSPLSRDARIGIMKAIRETVPLSHNSQTTLDSFGGEKILNLSMKIPWKSIERLYEFQPGSFQDVVLTPGVGQSTIRALCYISEVITGAKPSYMDPIKYSYALGGKDGVPKPIDHHDYDRVITFFGSLLQDTGFQKGERERLMNRLARESVEKRTQYLTNFH